MLACQQNILSTSRQVCLVLLGKCRNREGIPSEGVGVTEIGLQFAADSGNPDEV